MDDQRSLPTCALRREVPPIRGSPLTKKDNRKQKPPAGEKPRSAGGASSNGRTEECLLLRVEISERENGSYEKRDDR